MPGDAEEREHWAEAAQTYDAEHRRGGGEALENELRSWLTRQLTDADEVLELGCGTGIFSAMIAGRVKHLTATDFSPEMLEQARRRLGGYDNVEIRSEDACQTSFADDSFNAVLAVNLLHHAHAPATVASGNAGACWRPAGESSWSTAPDTDPPCWRGFGRACAVWSGRGDRRRATTTSRAAICAC